MQLSSEEMHIEAAAAASVLVCAQTHLPTLLSGDPLKVLHNVSANELERSPDASGCIPCLAEVTSIAVRERRDPTCMKGGAGDILLKESMSQALAALFTDAVLAAAHTSDDTVSMLLEPP